MRSALFRLLGRVCTAVRGVRTRQHPSDFAFISLSYCLIINGSILGCHTSLSAWGSPKMPVGPFFAASKVGKYRDPCDCSCKVLQGNLGGFNDNCVVLAFETESPRCMVCLEKVRRNPS